MAEATQSKHNPIVVDIPSQGIRKVFGDVRKALEWFAQEAKWLQDIEARLAGKIIFGGKSYNTEPRMNLAIQANSVVAAMDKPDATENELSGYIETYCVSARNLETIVSESYFGRRMNELLDSGLEQELKTFSGVVIPRYANFLPDQVADHFRITRTALLWHPAFRTQVDLISAEEAKESALDTQENLETASSEFRDRIADWEGRIFELERRYREQIALKEPANYWRRKAARHQWAAVTSFLSFVAILACGLLLGWWFIDDVERFLTATSTTEGTGGVVRGLAVVTVPTLAIAWLLRHISRIFVQNFTQRHDALNREMLAYTYLSLAENKDMEIGENERALILNALFRPAAPNAGDEGPPMGLIDFIKPK